MAGQEYGGREQHGRELVGRELVGREYSDQEHSGIREGGCLPPFDVPPFPVPPRPWPDHDPWLPDQDDTDVPSSLDDEFDWMSYEHRELYDMVNLGMNLTAAGDVAYGWEQLGVELDDISNQLTDMLAKSADAWQGEAAESARLSMQRLVDWTRRTGESATNVAACLTLQVENADQARRGMPEPAGPAIPDMDRPRSDMPVVGGKDAVAGAGTVPSGAGTIPSGVSPFVSRDVAHAPLLTDDQAGIAERDVTKRRQAAEVMQRFQRSSSQVYGRVPRFHDPTTPVVSPHERRPGPDDERRRTPPDDGPGPAGENTSTSSSTSSGTPPPGGGSPALGGAPAAGSPLAGSPATGSPGAGSSGSGSPGSPGAGHPAGGALGVSPHERGAASMSAGRLPAGGAAAEPAGGAARPAGAAGPAGAMLPPGGAAGGAQDKERSRPGFLEDEDDDLFGTLPAAPSVIGED